MRVNQKDGCDLLIGAEAKMLLHPDEHHLREKRVQEFFSTVGGYFQTVLEYLLDKLPIQDPILKAAVVVDPREKLQTKSSQLEDFVLKFPALIPESCSVDAVLEQFSCYHEGARADKFWTEVARKHPTFKDLADVMRGILTIPHSSAACERVFSMVRKTCTEGRASMLQGPYA